MRAVSLVLVAEMTLLLASAFRRASLYEAAYGFTTTRLHAQAYMVVMALGVALLAAEAGAAASTPPGSCGGCWRWAPSPSSPSSPPTPADREREGLSPGGPPACPRR